VPRQCQFWIGFITLACVVAIASSAACATEIIPLSDTQVIETLPAISGNRIEVRRLRRRLAAEPRDAALALFAANQYLGQAHTSGDPRFAGMAIESWSNDPAAPDAILAMRASIQQYLHEFDAAALTLQRLLSRPERDPRPQAWLMLATIRRVQGRYSDSDAACAHVSHSGAPVYASACLAENAGLRGDDRRARATFQQLIAQSRQNAALQAWLTTSLAELEQRAGHPREAGAAFARALQLDPDPYTSLDYADLLIEQQRPKLALQLLRGHPRTDAVLLRLAIAGKQANASTAAADAAEMRERIGLANQRPETRIFHGREQAMFALAVDRDATRALQLAQRDVTQQREPLDLLVLAQAARASGNASAIEQTRRITNEMGLIDRRTDALL